jgi:hypothetical protein
MISKKNQSFLEAMTLVETCSLAAGVTSYIWGGFTLDVYNGCFLREHYDLDYLTQNLGNGKQHFIKSFESEGWQAQELTNGDLRCIKNDIRIHLGNILISKTATWTHNGENGAISFPLAWLRPTPVLFQEVAVHVVEPEFEYVIKHNPHFLNPDWKPREIDLMARKQLQAMLVEKGVDWINLVNKIKSE